jgi:tetratricopeptide (TPR) repeat protein
MITAVWQIQGLNELTIARERMYKKRINEWNARKNYKREEKDAVCRALQRRSLAGKAHHQVMIRNQPAKVRRILKHMQNSGAQVDTQVWGCASTSTGDDGIEVRTPDSVSNVDDQSKLNDSCRDLDRRLSVTPGPCRPILTHDDLGKAEIICLEGVKYFETLLLEDTYTGPELSFTRHYNIVTTMNRIRLADAMVELERYADARVLLNRASDELTDLLREPLPELLPEIIDAVVCHYGKLPPFKLMAIFFDHAADLCEIRLGVRHPMAVIMRIYCGVDGRAQVFDAFLGSLLETALKKGDCGQTHQLAIYLMRRKSNTLAVLGQFDGAERILQRALTICPSVNVIGHGLSSGVLYDLAWLNVEGSQNYTGAKPLFRKFLQCVSHVDESWTILSKVMTLQAIARIAIREAEFAKAVGLLRAAVDLALEGYGAKHEETIYAAWILEEVLKALGEDLEADRLRDSFRLKDDSVMNHKGLTLNS